MRALCTVQWAQAVAFLFANHSRENSVLVAPVNLSCDFTKRCRRYGGTLWRPWLVCHHDLFCLVMNVWRINDCYSMVAGKGCKKRLRRVIALKGRKRKFAFWCFCTWWIRSYSYESLENNKILNTTVPMGSWGFALYLVMTLIYDCWSRFYGWR